MLSDVLDMEISLGSTQKAWEEASQAVAPPVNNCKSSCRAKRS